MSPIMHDITQNVSCGENICSEQEETVNTLRNKSLTKRYLSDGSDKLMCAKERQQCFG